MPGTAHLVTVVGRGALVSRRQCGPGCPIRCPSGCSRSSPCSARPGPRVPGGLTGSAPGRRSARRAARPGARHGDGRVRSAAPARLASGILTTCLLVIAGAAVVTAPSGTPGRVAWIGAVLAVGLALATGAATLARLHSRAPFNLALASPWCCWPWQQPTWASPLTNLTRGIYIAYGLSALVSHSRRSIPVPACVNLRQESYEHPEMRQFPRKQTGSRTVAKL